MALSWNVYVDWGYSGGWVYDYSQPADDITAYVRQWRINAGAKDENGLVAAGGGATIILYNGDKRFSPDYASGPYYGKLTTRLPVKITVTDGVDTWTRFQGFIRSITPEGGLSGRLLKQEATLEADDLIAILQSAVVNLILFENVTGDVIVKAAINAALRAPLASVNLNFSGNPANNDSIVIDGVTITFKTTLSGGANEVKIGATLTETIDNLVAMINQNFGVGTTYQGGTPIDRLTAEKL